MGHVISWERGDGKLWVQVGKQPLVAGVDVSGGQEKWE
jgi:hypothetical protein